ncbi:MAG: EthD domain-containing protein [Pigmentiphaga sp.]
MKIRIGLLRKQPTWSIAQFGDYWRDEHGPLAARSVPNLREYWQNLVTEKSQRGICFSRGRWDFDGFSELCFDAVDQANLAGFDQAPASLLREDERYFLGGLHILVAERETFRAVSPERRGTSVKRISLIQRKPGVSEADFLREWRVHANHVLRMPGVLGYRQNAVVGREWIKGHPCTYEELPVDGVVELWLESAEAIDASFGSFEGSETMRHADTFLQEITPFLVEERRIV